MKIPEVKALLCKQCRTCGVTKPLVEFSFRGGGERRNTCKSCVSKKGVSKRKGIPNPTQPELPGIRHVLPQIPKQPQITPKKPLIPPPFPEGVETLPGVTVDPEYEETKAFMFFAETFCNEVNLTKGDNLKNLIQSWSDIATYTRNNTLRKYVTNMLEKFRAFQSNFPKK